MQSLRKQNTTVRGAKKQQSPRFEKILTAYATAASAAGVAMLAAPSAEAKVVYTPVKVSLSAPYMLDLNHDGVPDFNLEFCVCLPHGDIFEVGLVTKGNEVRQTTAFPKEAAALPRNTQIGPDQAFTSFTSGYGGVLMAFVSAYGSYKFSGGPWIGATNRYLGLKFLINGQVHFGWARLTVTSGLEATLTGYAYETLPNKSIKAGQTTGAAEVAESQMPVPAVVPKGPSLGMLAGGADTLDIWRRNQIDSLVSQPSPAR